VAVFVPVLVDVVEKSALYAVMICKVLSSILPRVLEKSALYMM